jgi:hypothetical protein
MRAKADNVESDLTGLVDQLRTMVEDVVESVRTNAGSLEAELSNIRAGLAEVREAQPEPIAEAGPPMAAHPDAALVTADDPTEERAGADIEHEPAVEEEPAVEDEPAVEREAVYEEPDAVLEETDDDDIDADVEPLADEPEAEPAGEAGDGARLIALNMALNGTPREETARYLEENFNLEDPDTILDEVYARVGG